MSCPPKPPTRDQARAASYTLREIPPTYGGHLKSDATHDDALAVMLGIQALEKFARTDRDYTDPRKNREPKKRPAHSRTRAALASVRRLAATHPECWPSYAHNRGNLVDNLTELLGRLLELDDEGGRRTHYDDRWS